MTILDIFIEHDEAMRQLFDVFMARIVEVHGLPQDEARERDDHFWAEWETTNCGPDMSVGLLANAPEHMQLAGMSALARLLTAELLMEVSDYD